MLPVYLSSCCILIVDYEHLNTFAMLMLPPPPPQPPHHIHSPAMWSSENEGWRDEAVKGGMKGERLRREKVLGVGRW